MRRFGVLAIVAGLGSSVIAQSTFTTAVAGGVTTTISLSDSAGPTYTPTNTWTITSGACSKGMGAATATATAGGYGGVFEDAYGSYWEMVCV